MGSTWELKQGVYLRKFALRILGWITEEACAEWRNCTSFVPRSCYLMPASNGCIIYQLRTQILSCNCKSEPHKTAHIKICILELSGRQTRKFILKVFTLKYKGSLSRENISKQSMVSFRKDGRLSNLNLFATSPRFTFLFYYTDHIFYWKETFTHITILVYETKQQTVHT